VSEFDLGSLPEAFHFPRRNRIISGFRRACSWWRRQKKRQPYHGELRAATGKGRVRGAGSIFSEASAGTFALLKSGAIPVQSGDDIIENIQHLRLAGVSDVKAPHEA